MKPKKKKNVVNFSPNLNFDLLTCYVISSFWKNKNKLSLKISEVKQLESNACVMGNGQKVIIIEHLP